MKYIITCQMPSGLKLAFSVYEKDRKKTFALVPMEDGIVKKALSFSSYLDAQLHLERQLMAAPELEKLGPFRIEACMEPQ
jgi:hypothetical protein